MRIPLPLCPQSPVVCLTGTDAGQVASSRAFSSPVDLSQSVNCTQPIRLKAFSSSHGMLPLFQENCSDSSALSAAELIAAFHAASDGFLRKTLVVQAGGIVETEARDFLLGLLVDRRQTFSLRVAAAKGLAVREDISPAVPLIDAYRSESFPVKPTPVSRDVQNVMFFRRGILGALGTIRDGEARDFLFEIASDTTEKKEMRFIAMDALGDSGDPAAVESLAGIARGKGGAVFRLRAIAALGKIGGSQAFQTLSGLANDSRQLGSIRTAAVSAMGMVGGKAGFRTVAAAMESLETETDPIAQERFLNVLFQNPEARMVPAWEKAAHSHPSPRIRARALELYCIYAGESAFGTLTQIISKECESRVLREAFVGLQALGGVRILPALLGIRAHARPNGLTAAIANFDGPEAVTEVLKAFPEAGRPAQKEMIFYLEKVKSDPRVPAFFAGVLEERESWWGYSELRAAVRGVSDATDLRSFRALRAFIEEGDFDDAKIQEIFAKRCRKRGELFDLLVEGNTEERIFAVEKLAEYADAEADAFLFTSLKMDPDPSVRRKVIDSLRDRQSPELIDALMEAHRNDVVDDPK